MIVGFQSLSLGLEPWNLLLGCKDGLSSGPWAAWGGSCAKKLTSVARRFHFCSHCRPCLQLLPLGSFQGKVAEHGEQCTVHFILVPNAMWHPEHFTMWSSSLTFYHFLPTNVYLAGNDATDTTGMHWEDLRGQLLRLQRCRTRPPGISGGIAIGHIWLIIWHHFDNFDDFH